MPDSDVSISKHRYWIYFWRGVIALMFGLYLIMGVFLLLHFRNEAKLRIEVAVLAAQIAEVRQLQDAQAKDESSRLDDIERTLWGDVVARLDHQQSHGPNRIVLWQRNRDRELRQRILSLEQRVWRLEQ